MHIYEYHEQFLPGQFLHGLNNKLLTTCVVFFTRQFFEKVIDISALASYYRGSS